MRPSGRQLKSKPSIGGIYHIFNRGVEKRDIFLEDEDRLRFIYSLGIFNNELPALNSGYFFNEKSIEVELQYEREKMVEIFAFVLMQNHFHLMVRQITENGITEFMRKLGTGYTNYFNLKYQRVGPLFQGKYKSVLVQEHRHLLHLPFYIHLNPLDIAMPEWREQKVENTKQAMDFLESYRWSSHPEYIGEENFPHIIETKFLGELFESPNQYKKDLLEWLEKEDLDELSDIALELIY